MIEFVIGLLLGAAVGAWGYRYSLKKRPDTVAKLAEQIRAAGDRFSD